MTVHAVALLVPSSIHTLLSRTSPLEKLALQVNAPEGAMGPLPAAPIFAVKGLVISNFTLECTLACPFCSTNPLGSIQAILLNPFPPTQRTPFVVVMSVVVKM